MSQEVEGQADSGCPGLALVFIYCQPDSRSSSSAPQQTRPLASGTLESSQSKHLLADNLAFEQQELVKKG